MQVEILRGQNKIGGNIFEISHNATKILVEFGSELNSGEEITEFERSIAKKEYDCAIISHYHGDHASNIALLTCPIYMGNACKNILETMSCHMKKPLPKNICVYQSDKSFSVGEITVTPFLCDHSAYDSYMLLFEASGEKIFYTGDFRSDGRKNFDKLLEKLPPKIDTLIYEGTNLTRNFDQLTEKKLEEHAVEFFENNSGNIFILQASTNIDRLVSFYRAAKRSGRKIYIDDFQAQILLATSNKNVPNPNTFNDVYSFTARQIGGKRYEDFSKIENKIAINQIKNDRKAIVFVRQSMLPLIKRLCNSESKLIYSMWQGYEEKADMKSFLQEIQENSIKISYLHASGHASVEAINKLKAKVNAKQEIVVHTDIMENGNDTILPLWYQEVSKFLWKDKNYINFASEGLEYILEWRDGLVRKDVDKSNRLAMLDYIKIAHLYNTMRGNILHCLTEFYLLGALQKGSNLTLESCVEEKLLEFENKILFEKRCLKKTK